MKLSDCKIGILVNLKNEKETIGHVVGLGVVKNEKGKETVPRVHFADEMYDRIVHHGNLEVFKG